MRSMQGKVVLITGGTSGIGRAAAEVFARAGARIVLAARRAELGEQVARELQAQRADVRFVQADVWVPAEVDRLVSSTVEAYGRLDAARNNAATADGALALTADFTEEQFDRALAMNLKSVWLCLRSEIRQMLSQSSPGGAIVNTSSVNGLGGAPGGAFGSTRWWREPSAHRCSSASSRSWGAGRRRAARRPRRSTPDSSRWAASGGPRKRPKLPCGCVRRRPRTSRATR